MSDFTLDTNLIVTNSQDALTPLGIQDYTSKTSTPSNQKIWFDIKVGGNKIDQLSVKISNSNQVLYERDMDKYMLSIGHYQWGWDGFNTLDTFDSAALKQGILKAEFTGKTSTKTVKKEIKFTLTPANVDWAEVVINRKAKAASIKLRLNLKDGGQHGVGEAPPSDVQKTSYFKNLPQNDHRRHKHVRLKSHADLKALASSGMQQYWSRSISTPDNLTFNVKTLVEFDTEKAMDDINLVYNTNRDWIRSSNPGEVRGVFSLFGNFVPERISYNVGWIKYSNGWTYVSTNDADAEFKETAAHEIGHEILSAYGGDTYSYSHRGSSTVVTQTTKTVKNGGFNYPQSGDIDLMKYYQGNRPQDYFVRVYASESDVASLLWLNSLKIKKA